MIIAKAASHEHDNKSYRALSPRPAKSRGTELLRRAGKQKITPISPRTRELFQNLLKIPQIHSFFIPL